jgi:hypothetical protein
MIPTHAFVGFAFDVKGGDGPEGGGGQTLLEALI